MYLHTLEITDISEREVPQISQMDTKEFFGKTEAEKTKVVINLFLALNHVDRCFVPTFKKQEVQRGGSAQTLLQMAFLLLLPPRVASTNGAQAFQSLKASVVAL